MRTFFLNRLLCSIAYSFLLTFIQQKNILIKYNESINNYIDSWSSIAFAKIALWDYQKNYVFLGIVVLVIFYTEILTGKVVLWCFFLEWNKWKNPQFNFSSQNLSIERNFFKWDGKETKILHLLFHRIWKKKFLVSFP